MLVYINCISTCTTTVRLFHPADDINWFLTLTTQWIKPTSQSYLPYFSFVDCEEVFSNDRACICYQGISDGAIRFRLMFLQSGFLIVVAAVIWKQKSSAGREPLLILAV
jgi:hypothetical protein